MKIEDSNPCSLKSLMALMAFWLVFLTFPVRIIFREADGLGILPNAWTVKIGERSGPR